MTDVLRGQDYVLEAEDPDVPNTFFIIAGQSQTELDGDSAAVMVSNKDVNDNYQRVGNNMGEIKLTIQANGILADDASHDFLSTSFDTGLLFRARNRDLSTGKFVLATWKLTKFKFTGQHQQEMKYNYTLVNDGPLTRGTV